MPQNIKELTVKMVDETKKADIDNPTELARIVNVIGRFRKIDKEYFKRIAEVFEKMCTDS